MTALAAATDFAGLERFAYQLFTRAADTAPASSRHSARLHAAALDPARLQRQPTSRDEALGARSPIPLAYRLWLAHLLWLENVLHTLDCRPADVSAAELAGLQAVARARSRFLRAYEFCPRCDAANPRPATDRAARCRRCHAEY